MVVILGAGLGSCSGEGARGDMVVDTIGGVPSVISNQPAVADTLPWTLENYLVVAADQLYERKSTLLALDVAILEDGGVLVLDGTNDRVLRFDSLGAYVSSFGRSGEGPGQFDTPLFLEAADSEVYVMDVKLNRVSAFDTGGVFLRRFNVDLAGLVGTSAIFEAGGTGELYMAGEPAPFVAAARDTGRAVLYRFNRYGTIVDTVLTYTASVWTPIQRPDGGISYVKPRFAPEPRVSGQPGSVAVATGARYLIEVRAPDGTLRRRVARTFEPAPVTDAVRDTVLDMLAQSGLPRETLETVPFARVIPAIERLTLDEAGRLWVDPYIPDEPTRRDIFDAEGGYLGAVYLPLAMRLEDIAADRACGVISQPSGASAVGCFRIVGQ